MGNACVKINNAVKGSADKPPQQQQQQQQGQPHRQPAPAALVTQASSRSAAPAAAPSANAVTSTSQVVVSVESKANGATPAAAPAAVAPRVLTESGYDVPEFVLQAIARDQAVTSGYDPPEFNQEVERKNLQVSPGYDAPELNDRAGITPGYDAPELNDRNRVTPGYDAPELKDDGKSGSTSLNAVKSAVKPTSHGHGPANAKPPTMVNDPKAMEALFGPPGNWNDDFQRLFELPALNADQQQQLRERAIRVQTRFLDYAEGVVRQIVHDRLAPPEEQKVLPVSGLGILGGEKFIVGGVFFKFARDDKNLFDGNDALAQKAALNEIRSASALITCAVPRLHTTLSAVLRVKGHCVVATALAPLAKGSLVYGSDNAGATVHNDSPEFDAVVKQIAAKLNLAPHRVAKARGSTETVTVHVGADCEGHASPNDGRLYMLDLGRLLPPQMASHRTLPKAFLILLFRPEYMRQRAKQGKTPLSSDAFSRFGAVDFEKHNPVVDAAYQEFLRETVPQAAKDLAALAQVWFSTFAPFDAPAAAQAPVVGRAASGAGAAGATVQFDAEGLPTAIFDQRHPHSLELKQQVYQGNFICDICRVGGRGKAYHCEQCGFDVHPGCIQPVAEQMGLMSTARRPIPALNQAVHRFGVNMRFLGVLRQHLGSLAPSPELLAKYNQTVGVGATAQTTNVITLLRRLLLEDMIYRLIKNRLREALRKVHSANELVYLDAAWGVFQTYLRPAKSAADAANAAVGAKTTGVAHSAVPPQNAPQAQGTATEQIKTHMQTHTAHALAATQSDAEQQETDRFWSVELPTLIERKYEVTISPSELQEVRTLAWEPMLKLASTGFGPTMTAGPPPGASEVDNLDPETLKAVHAELSQFMQHCTLPFALRVILQSGMAFRGLNLGLLAKDRVSAAHCLSCAHAICMGMQYATVDQRTGQSTVMNRAAMAAGFEFTLKTESKPVGIPPFIRPEFAEREYQAEFAMRSKILGANSLELISTLRGLLDTYAVNAGGDAAVKAKAEEVVQQIDALCRANSNAAVVNAADPASMLKASTHFGFLYEGYNALARFYDRLGQSAKAIVYHQRVLDISEQLHQLVDTPTSRSQLCRATNNVAWAAVEAGDLVTGERMLLRAVELRGDLQYVIFEPPTELSNLALVYKRSGRLAQAEEALKKAIKIWEKYPNRTTAEFAVVLNNLAETLREQKRYDEAEPLYLRALEIDQRLLDSGAPATLRHMVNLALLYGAVGRRPEAEQLHIQAIKLRQATLPQTHPDLALSYYNLGYFYYETNDFAKAEPLLTNAFMIYTMWNTANNSQHPMFATAAFRFMDMQFRFPRSADEVKMMRQAYGPAVPQLAAVVKQTQMLPFWDTACELFALNVLHSSGGQPMMAVQRLYFWNSCREEQNLPLPRELTQLQPTANAAAVPAVSPRGK